MLDYTARMTAEGLGAEYCKVMEYISAENRLFVRAGDELGEGVVGVASVGADSEISCRLCFAHRKACYFESPRT